ncbi:nicotianamine aminotransferase 1-like [Silene latifolia]|uniref:nicotianamine aminotransferase 1-like n=1 Tax=Silene latifolia TaxID=37657 RepID=UPI003D771F71
MAKGETKEIIKWNFVSKEDVNNNNNSNKNITTTNNNNTKSYTVREARTMIMVTMNPNDKRSMLALGHGDPSIFPCFRTCRNAEDAVVEAIQSGNFNSYATATGLLPARKAVAEYLSYDLPYTLSASGVFLTVGCTQAIDVTLSMLSRPGANILLPRPGYPYYEIRSAYIGLEARHFDLVPENGWEVDLNSVEAQADSNTVAMVLINPGNPCGNVFTYNHLQKVAEIARKLGIMIISDEVYGQLTFGNNPFVPMGEFASIVPVITLGSLSKRWIVPGWRLGWLVVNDTQGILLKSGVVERIEQIMNKSPDPVSFIQAALPKILKRTDENFFTKIIDILRCDANICYEKIKEIPALSCPYKADGAMFMMVKLEMSLLEGIEDDMDFCIKLAKEENMIILPGVTVGFRNWLRITFALEPSALEEGLERLKAFCTRHAISPCLN